MYYPPKFICSFETVEYFKIPENVCVYGSQLTQDVELLANVTPLELGWEGHVALEFF